MIWTTSETFGITWTCTTTFGDTPFAYTVTNCQQNMWN